MKKVSIILFLSKALILGIDFNVNNCKPCGVTINRVTLVNATKIPWAVGDSGQVFKLNDTGVVINRFTLNEEYNLTGVSFADSQIGYIVGYKRDGSDKWRGGIWKTTNCGTNWDTLLIPTFPGNILVPFFNVHAIDERYAWISCGHGYVLKTQDGGNSWHLTNAKPGSSNHFGWLWGIDAQDENTAWVCSDQSGLIAKTTNGGDTWTNYEPYETDSLSFFDIDFYNNEAVAAASKGR